MAEQQDTRVAAIAVRSPQTGPMVELREARAQADGGIEGDVPSNPQRGVSFISLPQWHSTMQELGGARLPWHTRRANILVDADSLAAWIGRTVRVGDVEVSITAETRPCELMDRFLPGLRAALARDCRGGVHGRVVRGGVIRVGDAVTLQDACPA
ncbi:MAG: hypothetical protein CHACPFDD_01144 [Phycisphaerae bacterium]|nr:hypothetical protein [Phycisphaerae bacterium]